MGRNQDIQDDWHDSQPGDVGQLVQRLQGRRRALVTQQRMVVSLLVLLTAFTGYYFVGVLPKAKPNFGGIVCGRVHELMPQYLADSLDSATSRQIREHLSHCNKCRSLMDQTATGSTPVSNSTIKPPHNDIARQDIEQRDDLFLGVAVEKFASVGH